MIALNQQADTPAVELLATIAHDLRNPLMIVWASAALLRRQAHDGNARPAAWLDHGLAEIEEAGRWMARLIDDLVDLGQVQAGDPLALSRRPTDLAQLAAGAVARVQATSRRHLVRLELAQPSVTGCWDAARLRRVLENLLNNAIKYSSPDREIVVRVACEGTLKGDCAVLLVRDHGRGIPLADQAHIFTAFRRGSNVEGVAGSGLGLASVKQIVEAHGGSITVMSDEAQGTAVTVRLPRA
jgi:signal transduction histidine kinase